MNTMIKKKKEKWMRLVSSMTVGGKNIPSCGTRCQSRIMKKERNLPSCGTRCQSRNYQLFAGILDCFGRASLAMTAGGNVSSLRGTKQSRIMKQEETNNNEACTTLVGILDCFGRASLAMTSAREMTNDCSIIN
jgi:hypothetical protein